MEFFRSTVVHFISPIAHFFFQIAHFPSIIFSSRSHLYSILFLTLLYILPLLTHLGCFLTDVLFVLFFVCVFRIWFSCFVVCLSIFVIWFSCCCWCCFVLQEQHVISQHSHISLLVNKEIRKLHLCRLDSKSTKPTIIQMQNALQTFCRAC